jgi:hypothetical protein
MQVEAERERLLDQQQEMQNKASRASSKSKEGVLAFSVTIEFEDYASMITYYNTIEEYLELCQSNSYRYKMASNTIKLKRWWASVLTYNELLSNQVDFWKFNSVSEESFLSMVDTGDILLFRCNS